VFLEVISSQTIGCVPRIFFFFSLFSFLVWFFESFVRKWISGRVPRGRDVLPFFFPPIGLKFFVRDSLSRVVDECLKRSGRFSPSFFSFLSQMILHFSRSDNWFVEPFPSNRRTLFFVTEDHPFFFVTDLGSPEPQKRPSLGLPF